MCFFARFLCFFARFLCFFARFLCFFLSTQNFFFFILCYKTNMSAIEAKRTSTEAVQQLFNDEIKPHIQKSQNQGRFSAEIFIETALAGINNLDEAGWNALTAHLQALGYKVQVQYGYGDGPGRTECCLFSDGFCCPCWYICCCWLWTCAWRPRRRSLILSWELPAHRRVEEPSAVKEDRGSHPSMPPPYAPPPVYGATLGTDTL
jgi:hypothetical protein